MKLFNKAKILGIDIGTNTIKLCELDEHKKNAVKLVTLGMLKTPTGLLSNGRIEKADEMGAVVKQLVKNSKSKRKLASTSVWGSDTVIRKIVSHGVEDVDIIRDEANLNIPFGLDEVNLQYQKVATENEEYLILFAVNKNVVMNYVETISHAGLKCMALDTVASALSNCYSYNYDVEQEEVVAIADIGEQFTALTILKNGELSFYRDIDFGGYNYTLSIYNQLSDAGNSISEVEVLKKSQTPADEVLPIIKDSHSVLIQKLGAYLDQYCSTEEVGAISKLYITGGTSLIHGLRDTLSQSLTGVDVDFFDPFRRVEYDGKVFNEDRINELRPYSSVAVGLSLRNR